MSQENVETLKRGFEAFNRGDINAMLEEFDPDVEWHTASDIPDSTVYRGHDGVASLIQEWVNSFEDFRVDAEELIDRGEYVVLSVVLRGRIPGSLESDREVTLRRFGVDKVRNGKIVEVREYMTLEQVLEAVGLSE